MTDAVLFEKVAVIGLGLIGSSLCWRIRQDGMARHIAGYARTAATRDKAMELGFIDSAHDTAADAVEDADLIILCAPIGANAAIAAEIGPRLKRGTIVTDVGSVKACVVRDVGPFLPDGVHLVPGHPVAGTEHSGPESGFPELFEDRYCILTPPPGTDADAVSRVETLWRTAGSNVELMDPLHHDRVLAVTSHLPHLISFTIVGTASDLETQLRREDGEAHQLVETRDVIKFSAGGFRDFTRIAASDPVMWRDIFLNNREAVLELLGRFTEDIMALQRAIRWGEGDTLEDFFARTRAIRRDVIEAGQAGSFNPTEPEKE